MLASAVLAMTSAVASPLTFSGRLDDPGNSALVGPDLGAPMFTDVYAVANNVALYTVTFASAGTVDFLSTGFSSGGAAPYFSLFSGIGTGATFVASNYDDAVLGDGGDFDLTVALAGGDYTLAIGDFENESFAENYGVGTLGDGFIGLGDPSVLGNASYRLVVTQDTGTGVGMVPEPSSLSLMSVALLALYAARRRRPS